MELQRFIPKDLPGIYEDFSLLHANLKALDERVRRLGSNSKRARAIEILRYVITRRDEDIASERIRISDMEVYWKNVERAKMTVLNQNPPGSQGHKAAREEQNKACHQIYEYQTKLPTRLRDYSEYLESCEKVLDNWTIHDRRIMDLLQLIRNLRGVPDSSYRETRASCQNEAQKLRNEIRYDEKSLGNEKEKLEHEIEWTSRKDLRIKLGQEFGVPLNGRDHQIVKNLMDGALQEISDKFEGVGKIRVWSLSTDREYLDRLISYLKPGHRMHTFRINPDIKKCYRGVAHDWDS
ncbi:uncharacterized protein EAE98_004309 [Botrytis deweyae]|uniref:Uncharacterized protein n=1 Tax=Botrytis deweyae TaxID=2478750 RepID=A0ABQ7IQI8_9HELO|nr:uncharacterized protein EAE98_004309 [Botrytis deweyae]KAF7931573.1 hypothetical protein EAE98_004309 [Botrytis deweyae]